MRAPSPLFALSFLLFAACNGGDADTDQADTDVASAGAEEKADAESVIEDDVEKIAATLTEGSVPEEIEEEEGEETVSECLATWGGCQLCLEATGNVFAGDFVGGLDSDSCSESVGTAVSFTYTVSEFQVEGTWADASESLPLGDYEIEASGNRVSTLAVERPQASTSYSTDLEFTAAMLTDDYAMATYEMDLTYLSFGEHEWTVHAEGTPSSVQGSVQRDDGVTCSLSGTFEEVDVDCDE